MPSYPIQKQLNKVELGQKLSKAIFSERDSKFYVGEAEEMKKQAAATNLIKNIIILWNYLFLTDYLIKIKDKDERNQVVEKIAEGSVITHAHINLKGQFDFTSRDPRLIKTNKTKLMNFKAVV